MSGGLYDERGEGPHGPTRWEPPERERGTPASEGETRLLARGTERGTRNAAKGAGRAPGRAIWLAEGRAGARSA